MLIYYVFVNKTNCHSQKVSKLKVNNMILNLFLNKNKLLLFIE